MTTSDAAKRADRAECLPETTPERGREILDRASHFYLGISGEEFMKRWDSGFYDDDPEEHGVMAVATLLPFVRSR